MNPLLAAARRITAAVLTPPAAPVHGLLDEDELEQLLADGLLDGADFARCPAHQAVTAHALHTDGSQTCIPCGHTLNGAS
ncbi:hypothetical protein [Streptomyces sp. DSM 40484]|uniref:hypothetical protein n=1 Tax=Streptomyces kroppenstedtii TaxID=3051181 RepID=UPI0028CFE9F7|nr:hypothetical protein [Streptomyces sp. DSM 40484]